MNGVTMKVRIKVLLRLASLALLLILCGGAATTRAQTAKLEMGQLDKLGATASESVDVNIDERMMQLAAKFLSSKDPDEAKVKEVVNGLKGIYVKVFEFEREGGYTPADLASIRSQLTGPNWTRFLNFKSKKEGNMEVYLMSNASVIGGLVVLANEPKELVVINILGPVDIDKLTQLSGQFGIPDLEIEVKPKSKN